MAKHTLNALRARMESLRAEWRELPKRRDNALLKGDKDALLDTQIRERQIPYEFLQAIRQRTELFTEQEEEVPAPFRATGRRGFSRSELPKREKYTASTS
jgi:hypothetical protein